jgi:hypothetical protein
MVAHKASLRRWLFDRRSQQIELFEKLQLFDVQQRVSKYATFMGGLECKEYIRDMKATAW